METAFGALRDRRSAKTGYTSDAGAIALLSSTRKWMCTDGGAGGGGVALTEKNEHGQPFHSRARSCQVRPWV